MLSGPSSIFGLLWVKPPFHTIPFKVFKMWFRLPYDIKLIHICKVKQQQTTAQHVSSDFSNLGLTIWTLAITAGFSVMHLKACLVNLKLYFWTDVGVIYCRFIWGKMLFSAMFWPAWWNYFVIIFCLFSLLFAAIKKAKMTPKYLKDSKHLYFPEIIISSKKLRLLFAVNLTWHERSMSIYGVKIRFS